MDYVPLCCNRAGTGLIVCCRAALSLLFGLLLQLSVYGVVDGSSYLVCMRAGIHACELACDSAVFLLL